MNLKLGFFWARHKTRQDLRKGGLQIDQFPIAQKAFHLENDWEEISEPAENVVAEIPVVAPPELVEPAPATPEPVASAPAPKSTPKPPKS